MNKKILLVLLVLLVVNVALAQDINSGGSAYGSFSSDAYYVGGSTYNNAVLNVAGTVDDVLYRTERYGNFAYVVPSGNGNYSVTLKFAEIWWGQKWGGSGSRIFNVSIEGQRVLSNFDIMSKVPTATAYDAQFNTSVTDGVLNIVFSTVKDNAKVSAINISKIILLYNATTINDTNVTLPPINDTNITLPPVNETNRTNSTLMLEMPMNFTVAYISDLGVWQGFQAVGKMLNDSIIRNETQLLVINGDLGQSETVTPKQWNSTFNQYVPISFPVVITMGNHECQDYNNYPNNGCQVWDMPGGYKEIVKQRFRSVVDAGGILNLSSDARKYSLNFKGLRIIGVDAGLMGNDGTYAEFLHSELLKKNESRTVAQWHYENGNLSMSEELYPGQVSLDLYQDALLNGAVVMNGHKHYYWRSTTLSSYMPITKMPGATRNEVHVGKNYSYYTIEAVGGMEIIDNQTVCLPITYPYGCDYAAVIDMFNQSATNGVLFITYNVNGTLGKDLARFINIRGEVRDEYIIINDGIYNATIPQVIVVNQTNVTLWWNDLNDTTKQDVYNKFFEVCS